MNDPANFGMSVADYERMMAYIRKEDMENEARRMIAAHPVNNAYNTVIGVDLHKTFEEQLKACMKIMQQRFPEITQRKKFIMKTITPYKSKYGYDPSF